MKLRVLIALLILVALFFFAGKEEIINTVLAVRPVYLIFLAFVSYLLIWVSCVKWRLFLSDQSISIHYLMRLYTIGYFINLFAPSFVGGDALRSYQLGKRLENQGDAAVATFLERYTGLLAMTSLGMIFVFLKSDIAQGIEVAVVVCWVATIFLGLIATSSRVRSPLFQLVRAVAALVPSFTLLHKVITVLEKGCIGAQGKREIFARALIWSFLYHVLAVLNTYVCALAVGWDSVDLGGLFVIVPLVLIISLVPITPSGIGIQEGAFMFLLSRIGGTTGQALGVGILLRIKAVLLGVIGGLFWMADKKGER